MSSSIPLRLADPELIATVDDFLADVLREARIDSETVEAIRACFCDQSISDHEFIRTTISRLKHYPNLARKLNSVTQALGQKFEIVVNDALTVDLIVIHGPSAGQIYSVSDEIQLPAISNTAKLRALLEKDTIEPDFTNSTSSSSGASAVAELLQHQLTHSSLDNVYGTRCLRYLRRLAGQKGILPPSFFLPNVVRRSPNPIYGGGFTNVYKGELNGEVVCLKALRFSVDRSEMAQKLLIDCCREALMWKQLNHPNVLPFLGVNVELFAPSFCLVSPWMSNGNLLQFLRQHPDFDRRNAIVDIAAGMQYLHESSPPIVHADIRGGNILVRDNLRCCLADFGLSSLVASSSLTSSSSGDGKGSIRWLAPELFVRNQLRSTSRDIYAFACTILEVYTGQHPFVHHKHDRPVMHDVLAGRRPPRPSQLTDDLWRLVESCWQQDPARRPSAHAIMQFLRTNPLTITSTASAILDSKSSQSSSSTGNSSLNLNLQELLPETLKGRLDGEKTATEIPINEKGKRSRWIFGRSKASAKDLTRFRVVFGVPLQYSLDAAQISNLPAVVFRIIEYLEAGTRPEDIYRASGSYRLTQELKARFNAESDVDLLTSDEYWDPYAVADLLKTFLRELPDNITCHLDFFSTAPGIADREKQIIELSHLVAALPFVNYNLLRAVVEHLSLISKEHTKTMRIALSIELGPLLGLNSRVLCLMMDAFERVFSAALQTPNHPSEVLADDLGEMLNPSAETLVGRDIITTFFNDSFWGVPPQTPPAS